MSLAEQAARKIKKNRDDLETSARIVGSDINFMVRNGHLANIKNSTRLTLLLLAALTFGAGHLAIYGYYKWFNPAKATAGKILSKSEMTKAEIAALELGK